MDTLRVRAYNVRFGDAYLITVPDRGPDGQVTTRHILIDVGNALASAGGIDAVFKPVFDDIVAELAGRPLDLYVMTHEHFDHVQGLHHAKAQLNITFDVDYAWITASAEPGYHDDQVAHPGAKKRLTDTQDSYKAAEAYLSVLGDDRPLWLDGLLAVNRTLTSSEAVEYIRTLPTKKTTYIHRESDLTGTHPFQEAVLRVWAPEENTAVYYTRQRPVALGVTADAPNGGHPALKVPKPPPGVDAGAFYNLVEIRKRGFIDNLLAIDKAGNNSSIVFLLEWRGWKLLFPGDAEQRSWQIMDANGQLEEVHFLKISHHLSHTGTPPDALLNKILPPVPTIPTPDGSPRRAVASTWEGNYSGVPDPKTRTRLAERCDVRDMFEMQLGNGEHLDFMFPG